MNSISLLTICHTVMIRLVSPQPETFNNLFGKGTSVKYFGVGMVMSPILKVELLLCIRLYQIYWITIHIVTSTGQFNEHPWQVGWN